MGEHLRHGYLAESAALSAEERALFSRIAGSHGEDQLPTNSLLLLSRLLFQHHGQRAVILIDEYDAPRHERVGQPLLPGGRDVHENAGYHTTDDVEMPNNTRIRRTLRIPNAEIRELYRAEIIERFSSVAVTLQA